MFLMKSQMLRNDIDTEAKSFHQIESYDNFLLFNDNNIVFQPKIVKSFVAPL